MVRQRVGRRPLLRNDPSGSDAKCRDQELPRTKAYPSRAAADQKTHNWMSAHIRATLRVGLAYSSGADTRSEEHTSELQSPYDLVCRLLLEKKKTRTRGRIKDILGKKLPLPFALLIVPRS